MLEIKINAIVIPAYDCNYIRFNIFCNHVEKEID